MNDIQCCFVVCRIDRQQYHCHVMNELMPNYDVQGRARASRGCHCLITADVLIVLFLVWWIESCFICDYLSFIICEALARVELVRGFRAPSLGLPFFFLNLLQHENIHCC